MDISKRRKIRLTNFLSFYTDLTSLPPSNLSRYSVTNSQCCSIIWLKVLLAGTGGLSELLDHPLSNHFSQLRSCLSSFLNRIGPSHSFGSSHNENTTPFLTPSLRAERSSTSTSPDLMEPNALHICWVSPQIPNLKIELPNHTCTHNLKLTHMLVLKLTHGIYWCANLFENSDCESSK